jgi:hypothetical protein
MELVRGGDLFDRIVEKGRLEFLFFFLEKRRTSSP